MNKHLVVVSSATAEPVTVSECKLHMRIDTTADDSLIEQLIPVARLEAEKYTKRTLLPVTYKLILDGFPGSTEAIVLPRPPLSTASSNVSIEFVEDTTSYQTTSVSTAVYVVDYEKEPGRIYPAYSTNQWPSSFSDERKDCVRITYKAGYASRAQVPEPIKVWIKLRVASMYENREGIYEARFMNQMQVLPHNFYMGLLDQYRIFDE